MGNPQKCPVGERVPKQRVPKRYFAIFFHRVAWGGAPWDPIVFPAKVPIGITRSCEAAPTYKWTCRALRGQSQQRCLRPEAWRSRRATACAARNGCAASKTRLTTCQAQTAIGFESRGSQLDRRTAHSPTNVDVGTDPAGQVC